jgi:beta-xylosidase
VNENWLNSLKTGDTVVRMLAGVLPMPLKITDIKNGLIHCGDWTFDKRTGAEVDDYLEWGPRYGKTGSYLTNEKIN